MFSSGELASPNSDLPLSSIEEDIVLTSSSELQPEEIPSGSGSVTPILSPLSPSDEILENSGLFPSLSVPSAIATGLDLGRSGAGAIDPLGTPLSAIAAEVDTLSRSQAPSIEHNLGLDPADDRPQIVHSAVLSASDPDTAPENLTYALTVPPERGSLTRIESSAGLSFKPNSTNDRVEINPISNFPTDALTVELWARYSPAEGRDPYFITLAADGGRHNEFLLYDDYDGYIRSDSSTARTLGIGLGHGQSRGFDGLQFPDDDRWHHLAVTWESATGHLRAYVDGNLEYDNLGHEDLTLNTPFQQGFSLSPTGSLVFAQEQDSWGGTFQADQALGGSLADVRIWDRVRSPEEIRANYRRTLSGNEAGLVGYWNFSDITGAFVPDRSGNGNDGTVYNAAVVPGVELGTELEVGDTFTQADLDRSTSRALSLDGSTSLDIPIADLTSDPNQLLTDVTHEFWFRTTNPNTGLFSVVNLSDNNPRLGHDRHLYLAGGRLRSRLWHRNDGSGILGSNGPNLADGKWHHVAHTFGADVGGQRLYVDGELVARGTRPDSEFDHHEYISLGYSWDARSDNLNGDIDDVRIWNRVRTQEEIRADMNRRLTGSETDLLGYFTFNEKANTVRNIVSSTEFDLPPRGTLTDGRQVVGTGDIVYTPDSDWGADSEVGAPKSLSLDGTSLLEIPVADLIPETEELLTGMTHELWFRTDDLNAGLFSVFDTRSRGHDRHLYLAGGNLRARLWHRSSSGSSHNQTLSSANLNLADGQWHHVAHTFGTGPLK